MVEFPGLRPMGNDLVGSRPVIASAIATMQGFGCPLHADGAVTRSGTSYECDEGHKLAPPAEGGLTSSAANS